jgi:hypothetical protein
MKRTQVGLVAGPASPTEIARRLNDLEPPDGGDREGRYLLAETDPKRRTAVLSLPAPAGGSRLYNTSTPVTLTIGVIICYLALYAANLAWRCLSSTRPGWAPTSTNRSVMATCSC